MVTSKFQNPADTANVIADMKSRFRLPTAEISITDNLPQEGDTQAMNDMTRDELARNLTAIEERMDRRIDRMQQDAADRSTGYLHEISLRDEQLRRELDLRQESFRAEQALRDKAMDDRFSGFLAAQSERDKAWEKTSEARFDRIEKDIGSIKTDSKKVSEEVSGIKVTMAKYLGGAIVVGALASGLLGAALKHLIP